MSPLDELLGLLDLERIEENLYRGFHPPGRKHRLFGGQIIAQAMIAAARTVPDDRNVHSLHAYFLRPGDPNTPALFDVERIRDGHSFTTRRIVVIQNGKAIFNMDISFQISEEGLSHQLPMKALSPPDRSTLHDVLLKEPFISFREDHKRLMGETPQPPEKDIWLQANGDVPDDPIIHAALLAFESDNALLGTARLPHRGSYTRKNMQGASLDHAIWFHQEVRVDQWLLYSLDAPTAANARGFNRGSVYTADGTLLASCMQEGLMRMRMPDKKESQSS